MTLTVRMSTLTPKHIMAIKSTTNTTLPPSQPTQVLTTTRRTSTIRIRRTQIFVVVNRSTTATTPIERLPTPQLSRHTPIRKRLTRRQLWTSLVNIWQNTRRMWSPMWRRVRFPILPKQSSCTTLITLRIPQTRTSPASITTAVIATMQTTPSFL